MTEVLPKGYRLMHRHQDGRWVLVNGTKYKPTNEAHIKITYTVPAGKRYVASWDEKPDDHEQRRVAVADFKSRNPEFKERDRLAFTRELVKNFGDRSGQMKMGPPAEGRRDMERDAVLKRRATLKRIWQEDE